VFKRKKVDKVPDAVIHKWNRPVTDEGFVPLPKRLLRCMATLFDVPQLKSIQALLAIVDFKRPNLLHPPSKDYLAFIAGMSVAEFDDCLTDLERRGLIEIKLREEEATQVEIDGLLKKIVALTPDESTGNQQTKEDEF